MEDHIGMTPLSDVGPEREMMGIRYSGIPHYGESVRREKYRKHGLYLMRIFFNKIIFRF